ncbi:MAG TPA: hypothetical protein ENG87_01940 [Candidatus Pacearchaeota archaeon]|nr:hypothetical protein [Candidatus Pacearchaeota archaeon]HDZ60703.1 hypothetical protein [Candidatus Pacearchaeota archaeon]
MEQSKKEVIVNVLKKLDFVNWDRYFTYSGGLNVFGWIERDDNYKDFVLLEFVDETYASLCIAYSTSSKEYTEKIAEILNQEHSECKRVEHFCDINNSIKLSQSQSEKKNG